jgi:hypothetical protein
MWAADRREAVHMSTAITVGAAWLILTIYTT